MKYIVGILGLLLGNASFAQWAVFDDQVYQELVKINSVRANHQPTLQDFEEQAALSADFSTIELADRTRFITTQEDCGDEQLNQMHYRACLNRPGF